jgi:hypothetical protein
MEIHLRRLCAVGLLAATLLAQANTTDVRGVVVDESGKPLADVAIGGFTWASDFITAEVIRTPLARTDRDGRFALAVGGAVPLELLLFVAPGRVHVACPACNVALQPIVLPKDRTVAGRVRGPDGKGIAGARVEVGDWLASAVFFGNGRCNFPIPRTAVRTDEGGRFAVSGTCDVGMLVTISGDGIEPLELAAVAAGDALDVTVERFVPVVVTVRMPDGKPLAGAQVAWLSPRRGRFQSGAWMTRSDASGRALQPTRTATYVNCWREDGTVRLAAEAEVKPGAQAIDLPLTVRASSGGKLGEPVRIRATFDGKPVTTFRAAAMRCGTTQFAGVNLVNCLRSCGEVLTDALAGAAEVQPIDYGGPRLFVLVDAPGHPLATAEFDPADDLAIALQPATTVAGTVVDAKTAAPIAGARVRSSLGFGSLGFGSLDPGIGVAVTGADGSFALEREPAGARHLLCTAPAHGLVAPVKVDCVVGTPRTGLRIAAPPLLDFVGKTDLAHPPAGLAVRLVAHGRLAWSSDGWDYTNSFPVANDGTFRVRSVAPGDYDAQLLCSTGFRGGPPEKVEVGRVHVPPDVTTVPVAVAAGMPGRLHGTISGPVPPSRLGVVSIPRAEQNGAAFGFLVYEGPTSCVRVDGTYELVESPGKRTVIVFDLLTGVMLARDDADVPAGRQRQLDFALAVANVSVALGGPGWRADVGHVVEVRPQGKAWPIGVGHISNYTEHFCQMGCAPPPGTRSVQLWLPAGKFELRLYEQAQLAVSGPRSQQASETVTVEAGGSLSVDLALPAK